MKIFQDLLRKVRDTGEQHEVRTDADRISLYGGNLSFDLTGNKIPLVTTRFIPTKHMIHELLFFIRGETNIKSLQDLGVHIWDEWAVTDDTIDRFIDTYFKDRDPLFVKQMKNYFQHFKGSIGPMYGHMWRNAPRKIPLNPLLWDIAYEDIPSDKKALYQKEYEIAKIKPEEMSLGAFMVQKYYGTVDQLNELIRNLKKYPYSARLIMESWNPDYIPCEGVEPGFNVLLGYGALAPCHKTLSCYVLKPLQPGGKKRLVTQLFQRSADLPLGVPWNLAEYGIISHMLAKDADMEAVRFIWSYGDAHIYSNQLSLIQEQLDRDPYPSPTVWLNPEVKSIFDYKPEDIRIEGYQYHPAINYPRNV